MSHDPEKTRELLQRAAENASTRAAEALGMMVGRELRASTLVHPGASGQPLPPPAEEVSTLFHVEGVRDCTFLVSFPRATLGAVRQLLAPGTDETTVPDDMVALEVANICTSHFLNSIGDLLDRRLLASPPASAEAARAGEGDYVIEVAFVAGDGVSFGGAFHFRPGEEIIGALHGALRQLTRQ